MTARQVDSEKLAISLSIKLPLLERENPKHKHQRPLHSSKVTVWAVMLARGIIGLYFLENERGRVITVTSERYLP